MPARNKTQHNKPKKKRQASRKLTPAPRKLSLLIYLINKVPPDVELPDLQEFWAQGLYIAKKENDVEKYKQHLIETIEKIEECLNRLPKSFSDSILPRGSLRLLQQDELWPYINIAIEEYSLLRRTRSSLRKIIEFFREPRFEGWTSFLQLQSFATTTKIRVSEDGTISVYPDELATALDGVEAKRIRECAICRKIFWAGRITQQCCLTACAHALRNRRYRANYKEYLIRRHAKENESAQQNSRTSPKMSQRNSKIGKKV